MMRKTLVMLFAWVFLLVMSPLALAVEKLEVTTQTISEGNYQLNMKTTDKTKKLILQQEAINQAIAAKKKFVVNMSYITATIDPATLVTTPAYKEVASSGEPVAVYLQFEVYNLNDASRYFTESNQNYKGYYKEPTTCFSLHVYMMKGGIQQSVLAEFPAITVTAPFTWDRFQYSTGDLPASSLRYYWLDETAALATSTENWQYISSSVNTTTNILTVEASKSGLYMGIAAKTTPATEPTSGFSDTAGHWAKDDITYLQSKNVIVDEGTTFYPNTSITRARFAAYLVRALGISTDSAGSNPFQDVSSSHPLYAEIIAAYHSGIVSGVAEDRFAPAANISRQEMAVMMMRALAYANKAPTMDYNVLADFVDKSSIAAWAKDGAAIAVRAGLISGESGNRFAPLGQATKAEAAAILSRLCRML